MIGSSSILLLVKCVINEMTAKITILSLLVNIFLSLTILEIKAKTIQGFNRIKIESPRTMSSSDLFGWDLLYKTVENKVTREEDVIIALAHWFLTKHFNLRCIGVGDDKTLNENDSGSELLPEGWNDCEKTYALRYVADGNLYILLAAKTEDTIVMNLLDVKSRNVSNLALNPKETVKALRGTLNTMIPESALLLDRFRKELVEPVFVGNKREVTTQTQAQAQVQTYVPAPRLPDDPFGMPPMPTNPFAIPTGRRDPLRDIGRGDLDPLGRGGGGMIFSPPPGSPFGGPANPDGIGPLAPGVRFPPPPGARFDPFGPPDPQRNIRPNPNPNHFRPPPDFDDMYM